MAEQAQPRLSHQDISGVFASLLMLPRAPKTLHPSQDRTRYAQLLEWLQQAMKAVVKGGQGGRNRAACEQQLRVMVALLQELAQLGRKECAQKGALLQRVREYLVGTLNAYWLALQSSNKEVWYQFQHNSVRVQRQYMQELHRLQGQVDELRKDKDHRWRNMFMLIKDNRIHRRQNHKLMRSICYQMEKNVTLAEQMLLLRQENEKLKVKLACFEDDTVRIDAFAQTHLKLLELKESIRTYPKRSKKILKNDLVKIQIQQIASINDKITFIIKAIEETGEIIDEFYDEENIWSNFHYNISTQTDNNATDDKATNTPHIRTLTSEASVTPHQLAAFQLTETYSLMVRGIKKERKETREGRQSRMPMMLSSTFSRFSTRREEAEKARDLSQRTDNCFSICESVKMTINNGRIIYISTYNTQIFNGPDLLRKIGQKIDNDPKPTPIQPIRQITEEEEQPQRQEVEVQTDPEDRGRSQARQKTKFAVTLPLFTAYMQEEEKARKAPAVRLKIIPEINIEFTPNKEEHSHKLKSSINPTPPLENKESILFKSGFIETPLLESTRFGIRSNKRLNSLQKFHWQSEEGFGKKGERDVERSDFCTQTQNNPFIFKATESTQNLEEQPATKDNSNSSSFLQDIKQVRKQVKEKAFNQSVDSLSKPKSKLARRSQMSPLKQPQSVKKMQKISKHELLKHKRTSTENSQLENISETTFKVNKQFRMKPLHRISEVLTEADPIHEDSTHNLNPIIPSKDKGLPLAVTREGEIRGGDFGKGVEKILKSMDIRRNQIISNGHTLKSYLSSYFKCLYGRDIYSGFLSFLASSDPQEAVVCFSRLGNTKAPEPYLVDIFRGFVKAVGKCYVVGESPCSPRLRQEILRFLAGLFLEQQQINSFAMRMRSKGCYTLMGWFNSLQLELRTESLHSQLYRTLSLWTNQASDMLSYEFIQQLCYFLQNDHQTGKFLIRCKFFLGERVALHRFCLFAHRCQWHRMLAFQTTIQDEYARRLGSFVTEESLHRIQLNRAILEEFKELEKCFGYWCSMSAKYGSAIERELLMLIQLNIQEYRLKNQMPLSRDLKYLSLIFEGLQKKKEFQSLRAKVENGTARDSLITSKTVI